MLVGPVLQIDALCVSYGGPDVLSEVSFTIAAGEAHCLLGANGAGKTTLIRAIAGRVRPRSGRVVRADRGIGLVPQDIALFPGLTVAENLEVFARLAGLGRAESRRRLQETADATGLTPRRTEIVSTLSGGWKRRVNIAAALLHRPGLLILDEPTAGVDIAARAELHALMRGLLAGGIGILMTTHDMAEAEAVCSHVIVLNNGRVLDQGPVGDLLARRLGPKLSLSLTLEAGPDAAESALLVRLGFDEVASGPTMPVEDERGGLAAVAMARDAGIKLRGFRIQRRGLTDLSRGLAGREA